jgi:hypothetical protein
MEIAVFEAVPIAQKCRKVSDAFVLAPIRTGALAVDVMSAAYTAIVCQVKAVAPVWPKLRRLDEWKRRVSPTW